MSHDEADTTRNRTVRGLVATGAATATLTLLATQRLTLPATVLAVVLVTVLVGAGRWFGSPTAAATGLLGLGVLVAVGPGSNVGPGPLLVWVVAVWTVVLATAGSLSPLATPVDASVGDRRPRARDARTRLRLLGADLAAAAGGLLLVPLALGTDEVAAGWAVTGAVTLVAVLLATGRPARGDDERSTP